MVTLLLYRAATAYIMILVSNTINYFLSFSACLTPLCIIEYDTHTETLAWQDIIGWSNYLYIVSYC